MIVTISPDNKSITVVVENVYEYGTYTFNSIILDDALFTYSFSSLGTYVISFEDMISAETITDIIQVLSPNNSIVTYLFAYKEYQDCFLDKIKKSKLDECGVFKKKDCNNCDEESLVTFSTLLKGIQVAEELSKVDIAVTIYEFIEEFYACNTECGC